MNSITIQDSVHAPGSPVVRLREIARRCESCEPLDANLSVWLGTILKDFLERETSSLEEILGLCYGRGGMPWRRAEAMRDRDAALRALAGNFFATRSPCTRSREIAILADRYGASAWLIDRKSANMPECYTGTHREYLWRAFKSGAAMPLGERQIRNILGG